MSSKFEKLPKEELIELLESLYEMIQSTRNSPTVLGSRYYAPNFRFPTRTSKNLKTLIGTIPFLLMDEKIFEKNQDIANFANTLNIKIPWPEKKKKEDIIGRIIVSISKFDDFKLNELNNLITKLTSRKTYDSKASFFADWDNAIKNMRL